MNKSRTNTVKREQKKSFLLRELSSLLQTLANDEAKLSNTCITRVELSADTGICYVYFSSFSDDPTKTAQELFDEILPLLKLYKPSLRKALARSIQSRYVPDLMFLFDEKKEKVDKMNQILNKVHEELEHEAETTDNEE